MFLAHSVYIFKFSDTFQEFLCANTQLHTEILLEKVTLKLTGCEFEMVMLVILS